MNAVYCCTQAATARDHGKSRVFSLNDATPAVAHLSQLLQLLLPLRTRSISASAALAARRSSDVRSFTAAAVHTSSISIPLRRTAAAALPIHPARKPIPPRANSSGAAAACMLRSLSTQLLALFRRLTARPTGVMSSSIVF